MPDEQMTIEDGIAAAIAARDEAIDRVEKNTNPDWAEAAMSAHLFSILNDPSPDPD
jgi:sensor domain CHASE-containing protein